MPNIKQGESGTRITIPPQITSAGNNMLPVPRMTLASAFITQSKTFPANTTFEYWSAARSEPSRPPSAV